MSIEDINAYLPSPSSSSHKTKNHTTPYRTWGARTSQVVSVGYGRVLTLKFDLDVIIVAYASGLVQIG